jgi:hypothetical protein
LACFIKIFLLGCLLQNPVFSWNAVGHRLVAQIAWDHLDRHAKTTFNQYNRAMDQNPVSKSIVNASVWLDTIRARTHDYDALHYIDLPFSTDGTSLPPVSPVNAVQAVERSVNVLTNPDASPEKKGLALRILVHVVGDIHQPLHAATRVSRKYPEGDHGGNFVLLHKNRIAKNLHAYWDKGAGLFVGKRRYGQAWIKQKALSMEQRWSCNMAAIDLNAMDWARESHALAVKRVYVWLPDRHNQHALQQIAEQRIALAGCRLAGLMNRIDHPIFLPVQRN